MIVLYTFFSFAVVWTVFIRDSTPAVHRKKVFILSAVLTVLPPAAISIYIASATPSYVAMPVITLTLFLHMFIIRKYVGSGEKDMGKRIVEFVSLHLLSATAVWAFLL